jgi:carbonic anhydrase
MAPRKTVVEKGSDCGVVTSATMDRSKASGPADASASPTARGKNFLSCEDVIAVQAYFRASEDSCKGSRQKKDDFFKQVGLRYEELRANTVSYEVRRIQASPCIVESWKDREIAKVHLQYQARTGSSVAQRVMKYIIPDYTKFRSILQQVSSKAM